MDNLLRCLHLFLLVCFFANSSHIAQFKHNWRENSGRMLSTVPKNLGVSKSGKHQEKSSKSKKAEKVKVKIDNHGKSKAETQKDSRSKKKKSLHNSSSAADSEYPMRSKQNPDIFIIGVQKGGTTSLHDLFIKHPKICRGGRKEKHFFDSEVNWRKGSAYYDPLFSFCSSNKLTIDATPIFAVNAVPQRIASFYSWESIKLKKFIVILRHPVAREFSFFKHQLRECERLIRAIGPVTNVWFSTKACQAVCLSYTPGQTSFDPISFRDYYRLGRLGRQKSYYLQQLRLWLSVIMREQLFVLNMETLLMNTSSVMTQLQTFLGLPTGWGKSSLPHDNDSSFANATLDCETFDSLKAHYEIVNAGLYDYIRSSNNKPPTEPYFPDFTWDKRRSCVDTDIAKSTGGGRSPGGETQQDAYTRVKSEKRPDIFFIGFHHHGMVYTKNLMEAHSEICVRGTFAVSDTASINNTSVMRPSIGQLSVDASRRSVSAYGSRGGGGGGDEDDNTVMGAEAYLKQFSSCSENTTIVDMSVTFHRIQAPVLLHSWYSPAEIRQKKFILILQDPVAHEYATYRHQTDYCGRLLSHQQQHSQKQLLWAVDNESRETKKCHKVWHKNSDDNSTKMMTFQDYLDAGHIDKRHWLYVMYLQAWLDVIDRDQLFVISYNTLVKNTSDVVSALASFLGLRKELQMPRVGFTQHASVGLPALVIASDCVAFYALCSSYAESNAGLFAILNSDRRPKGQPLFPPLQEPPPHCAQAIAQAVAEAEAEAEAEGGNGDETASETAGGAESGAESGADTDISAEGEGDEGDNQNGLDSRTAENADSTGAKTRTRGKENARVHSSDADNKAPTTSSTSPSVRLSKVSVTETRTESGTVKHGPPRIREKAAAVTAVPLITTLSSDSTVRSAASSTGAVSGAPAATSTTYATSASVSVGGELRKQIPAQLAALSNYEMAMGAIALLLGICCATLLLGFLLQACVGSDFEFVTSDTRRRKRPTGGRGPMNNPPAYGGGGTTGRRACGYGGSDKMGELLSSPRAYEAAGQRPIISTEAAALSSTATGPASRAIASPTVMPLPTGSLTPAMLRLEDTSSEVVLDDVLSRRMSAAAKQLRSSSNSSAGAAQYADPDY